MFLALPHSFVPLEPLHAVGCKGSVLTAFGQTPCLSAPQTTMIGWELDRRDYRAVVFALTNATENGQGPAHPTMYAIHTIQCNLHIFA